MRSSRPEGYRIIVKDNETFGLWLKSSDKKIEIGSKKVGFDIDPTSIADDAVGNKEDLTIKLREVTYCKDGTEHKMLILASEPYDE